MFRQLSKRKAQATIEYMAFLIILMLVLIFFGKYLVQSFVGNWRETGESFGFGMQYDPANTLQCKYDTYTNTASWYNLLCFEASCDCHTVGATISTCYNCILQCAIPECQPND